ncbi:BgTH12-03866 [Blumeria graminis f. sp. triticale]|uniref:BgTH12-03866 n=1 Tax=Blumeria graminis f. sp. triticale TaxID=1689686 RepID=A0A9W4CVY2_BLUGR|nr:BgTH12-03866 [Blumeria graminis f. sp. triticale]
MSSSKRSYDGSTKESKLNMFIPMFEKFRDDLDKHHDRRERVIKASRDITAASKKMFNTTNRVRELSTDYPPKLLSEISEKEVIIRQQFESIRPDLQGINSWRYQPQISPGLQEFVEAISLQHYLRTQTIISLEESSKQLPSGIELSGEDFLLGLFDVVGELMRFAITTMATTAKIPGAINKEGSKQDILMDLRTLRAHFEELCVPPCRSNWLAQNFDKKMEVMRQCVQKVEHAAYGKIVRGQERPLGWFPPSSDE